MASLSIRKIPEEVIARLRVQAATNGVSMEEQARRLLRAAVMTDEPIGSLAVGLFGDRGQDLALPEREVTEPVLLS